MTQVITRADLHQSACNVYIAACDYAAAIERETIDLSVPGDNVALNAAYNAKVRRCNAALIVYHAAIDAAG